MCLAIEGWSFISMEDSWQVYIIMMVADALVPNWHQDISNHNDDS